jgi:hypothetical protein
MGKAFQIQAYGVSDPSSSYTALVPATGDSLSVGNFALTDVCYMQSFDRIDATKGVDRIRSPKLHDNVKGIHIASAENPTIFALPPYNNQTMYPQDTLIIEATGSASTFHIATLGLYYTNYPGISQRLHAWGDISGNIQYIDTVEIAVTNSGTANVWTDTSITTTDNLLRANTDYAVLGYATDLLCAAVAIKGPDTSSVRVGGPGKVAQEFTADYFVRMSNLTGRPCIPVFNSANANGTFVSTIDITTSSTPNITLILACLAQNLSS